jgi:rod shape-determining protein MreC
VTKVEQKNEVQLVEVVPTVRFDRLDMVWVVLATAPGPDPKAGGSRRRLLDQGMGPLH